MDKLNTYSFKVYGLKINKPKKGIEIILLEKKKRFIYFLLLSIILVLQVFLINYTCFS